MTAYAQLTFAGLLDAGFTPRYVVDHPVPYFGFDFGDGFELALEPLTFGRWALALYRDHELVLPTKLEISARA